MKVIKYFVVVLVVSTLVSCSGQTTTNKSLKTELDSVSYAAGLSSGTGIRAQLKQGFSEADKDLFIQGIISGIDSTNILIDQKELQGIISNYFRNKEQNEATAKAEEEFGEIKKEGEAFLEENKLKEGVITTDSGLQYIVLTEGSGEKPTTSSRVKVHYHGTTIDGSVFDSSVDRGTPSEFGVLEVVKGWTEGLQLMNVGAKYRFFIPQELAYGATPRRGGPIKPFAMLIFDLELLEIK